MTDKLEDITPKEPIEGEPIENDLRIFQEILGGQCDNYPGLTHLTREVAVRLVAYTDRYLFSKLKSISPEVIEILAKGKHWIEFYLDGLESIDKEIVRVLVEHVSQRRESKTGISLSGLKTIDEEIAAELAKYNGNLALDGLESISPEVARELAKHGGYLVLNGLKSISPEVARELANKTGDLVLDGLESISPEVARELAKYRARLHLNGLKSIDEDVATELAVSAEGIPFVKDSIRKRIEKVARDRC